MDTLNKHAPLKKKVIGAHHGSYVTKSLWKVIMKPSKLQKIYFLKKDAWTIKKVQETERLLQ